MISEQEVKHIAKLARINLTDEEVKKFSHELSDIFQYVELLKEADTGNVEETSQVTGLENITQTDEIERKCDGNELLDCSPLPKERGQIRTKPVITNN